MKLSIIKNPKLLAFIIFILFLMFYLLTLSPTVNFIDSGELAAVCCTLGIAHPTGYPLFTLLGFLFSKIPFIGSEIYKLNLMAAVFCSLSLFFLFKLIFLLNENINRTTKEKNSSKTNPKKKPDKKSSRIVYKIVDLNIIIVSSLLSVLVLGLSKNFWQQSTSIEVYSLHCLFIGLLLYIFTRNIYKPVNNEKIFVKNEIGWMLFAFILGSGFTNHMSTIFLAPGMLFLYFRTYGFKINSLKRILLMSLPFLLGLSFYLYLPIRASQDPEINWGNPRTWEYFIRHISGKQFQVWVFSSFSESMKQLNYFLKTVPADFLYLPIIIAFPGLFYLFQRARNIFYFTIILFLTCMCLAINYSIHDIDSYFLLCYFMVSIWSGFGIINIFNYIQSKSKKVKITYVYLFLLIPFFQLKNYSDVNESNNFLVEDYTMNVFNSVKENGIVISYQWDNWVSASLYYQHVLGIRKDIVVIDKELLRRSWYFNMLKRNYPWLIERSKMEIEEFLNELYKFEKDIPYDPATIQNKFINMINSFIDKNIQERPVYLGSEIEKEVGDKYQKIPEGLLLRLYKETQYHDFPILSYRYRAINKMDRLIEQLNRFYALQFTERASYESFYGNKEKALWYLNKAIEIFPNYLPAINLLNKINKK